MRTKTLSDLARRWPERKSIFSQAKALSFWVTVAAVFGALSSVSAQLIIESSGELLLKRGNSEYRQCGVGERLQPGDRLYPTLGTAVKVLCGNSDVWRVPDGIPSGLSSGCPTLMVRLVKGETRHRPGGSDPKIPYILHPRMTYVVRERPTFRWNGVAGATRYRVRLLGPGGVEWQTDVSSTEVAYPVDAPPLNWGVKYLVTVEADTGSSSLEDGGGILGFELLDEYTTQDVQTEAGRIAGLSDLTEDERTLALAEMYRKEGLIAEAIATLEAAIDRGSPTALMYRLLGDLYSEVGLNLLAEARYASAVKLIENSLDRFALAAARAGLAGIELMLGKLQESERLSNQAEADYIALGHPNGATVLEQQLSEASAIKERLTSLASLANASSVSQILTPRD